MLVQLQFPTIVCDTPPQKRPGIALQEEYEFGRLLKEQNRIPAKTKRQDQTHNAGGSFVFFQILLFHQFLVGKDQKEKDQRILTPPLS